MEFRRIFRICVETGENLEMLVATGLVAWGAEGGKGILLECVVREGFLLFIEWVFLK